ncbi:2-amino-5-chloromuconate deaminase CnbZ [Reyranella sp.]|uniref:2-amino-5-chloromuconate deaminase CnbZ n=1 Tax=Reyranella sp. TaxID=1929291 RepID=UPI003BAB6057
MAQVLQLEDGGYDFIKGVFQYSGGVAARPGLEIERARFARPLPLAEGFAAVEAHLKSVGRPVSAFCACELRSPAPFTEDGFAAFNRVYAGTLDRWGVLREGVNPVARTNVCPELDKPPVPSFYAFSYTVPAAAGTPRTFVASGSGEAPEAKGTYRDNAIRLGDTSRDGLREKARWVLGEMERRMAALGFAWADATGAHLYTVHDVHPFLAEELAARGAMKAGLSWHFARPPVEVLDYEMDVRGVLRERVLPVG